MIDAIAMKIGTSARKEANTKLSTISAPTPPSTASSSTPGPSSPPLACWSASKPVRCTGAPPTAAPASAVRAFSSAFGLSPKAESGSGFG
jgi:hypothetical protein